MKKQLPLCVILTLMTSGCMNPTRYYKEGETKQQFAADQAFCNAQAQPFHNESMMGLASFIQQKEMCMEGKGYTKISQ